MQTRHTRSAGDGPTPGAASTTRALLRAARPKQWAKNVLVFAAPAAAGVLDEPDQLVRSLVAFACFCLAASGTYLLNDAQDVEADRRHPTKRLRPVAAGELGVGTARVAGVVAVVAGVALGFADRWQLGAVVAGYVALTTAYTVWLKHVPLVDLVAVAAGFVVRAVAGALATDVPVSDWFLLIASSGSLFIVAGKRHAELRAAHGGSGATRPILEHYTDSFLVHVRSVTAAVVVITYCLWAIERLETLGGGPWVQLSILPVAMGVLRYSMLVDAGQGEAPEDLVLGDRMLQVLGVAVVGLLVTGIYAG